MYSTPPSDRCHQQTHSLVLTSVSERTPVPTLSSFAEEAPVLLLEVISNTRQSGRVLQLYVCVSKELIRTEEIVLHIPD